jgi:hypothetical protein
MVHAYLKWVSLIVVMFLSSSFKTEDSSLVKRRVIQHIHKIVERFTTKITHSLCIYYIHKVTFSS